MAELSTTTIEQQQQQADAARVQALPVTVASESDHVAYLVQRQPEAVLSRGGDQSWGSVIARTNDYDLIQLDVNGAQSRGTFQVETGGGGRSAFARIDTNFMNDEDRARFAEQLAAVGGALDAELTVQTGDPILQSELMKHGFDRLNESQGTYRMSSPAQRQAQADTDQMRAELQQGDDAVAVPVSPDSVGGAAASAEAVAAASELAAARAELQTPEPARAAAARAQAALARNEAATAEVTIAANAETRQPAEAQVEASDAVATADVTFEAAQDQARARAEQGESIAVPATATERVALAIDQARLAGLATTSRTDAASAGISAAAVRESADLAATAAIAASQADLRAAGEVRAENIEPAVVAEAAVVDADPVQAGAEPIAADQARVAQAAEAQALADAPLAGADEGPVSAAELRERAQARFALFSASFEERNETEQTRRAEAPDSAFPTFDQVAARAQADATESLAVRARRAEAAAATAVGDVRTAYQNGMVDVTGQAIDVEATGGDTTYSVIEVDVIETTARELPVGSAVDDLAELQLRLAEQMTRDREIVERIQA